MEEIQIIAENNPHRGLLESIVLFKGVECMVWAEPVFKAGFYEIKPRNKQHDIGNGAGVLAKLQYADFERRYIL